MLDALKFLDPDRPQEGFVFDGRVAEDFKLTTGTWVSVGALRARLIAECAPYVEDVVIAGHDRDYIAVLIVPHLAACARLVPEEPAPSARDLLYRPQVRSLYEGLLNRMAQGSTGSSNRVLRALLLEDPPSLDRGEMTDKGSISQRSMLEHRATLVEELYSEPPSERLIVVSISSSN
jgi:feruloyl-CoA synthase